MRPLVIAIAGLALVSLLALGGLSATGAGWQQSAEPTPFEANRTARLLESRVACLGCHVIDGRGGQIGPSLDGLGDRVELEYVEDVIRDPATAIPGTLMPRQRMPEREVSRLAAYLVARPPATGSSQPDVTPEPPPTVADSQRDEGGPLYARHCAACHGTEGRGDGWNAPTLPVAPTAHADAALMSLRTDDSLYDAIFAGAYVLDGSTRMPPYGDALSPDQIRAVVRHIRTLCSCTQPDWAGGE